MKLQFCGAAGEVTGSCTLLEAEGKKILIDCGFFQGGKFLSQKNLEDFPFDPKTIDYVLLTHAHQDHCGRLPKLYLQGFHGQIFATEPTIELVNVMLADSAGIMEEEYQESGIEPLYFEKDILALLPLFKKINYAQKVKLTPTLWVEFRNAGHILGAAIIEIWAEGKKLVFSGDIGHKDMLMIEKLEEIQEADFIICESTYGDRIHKVEKDKSILFKEIIRETVRQKGVLLIPAFALERTQEILYELNYLVEKREIEPLDIFVDSPLAIRVTKIFERYQEFFNLDAKKQLLSGDDLFNFPHLQYTPEVAQSKYINNSPKPKVIISGSGMCNGGRILYHMERYIPDSTTQVFFVGYQVKGTRGRAISEGAKAIQLKDRIIPVRAKILQTEIFSGHADQTELVNWLSHFNLKKVQKLFLAHGDPEARETLSKILEEKLAVHPVLPNFKEIFTI